MNTYIYIIITHYFTAMTRTLYDRGREYQLTENGAVILKDSGKGRVLTALLNGEELLLPQIKEISGWTDPKKSMGELSQQIYCYLGMPYEIKRKVIDNMPIYRIEKPIISPKVVKRR